jgi:lipid II:glycine glycyltransferase (peptidoglycan interpeptide bridge formation enzyme)
MSVRIATPDEVARWDDLIVAQADDGNIFSTKIYSEIKKMGQYTPVYLMVGAIPVTVLQKNTPPIGKWWYVPKGPNTTSTTAYLAITKELKSYARHNGVFMIRTESELPLAEAPKLEEAGLRKAAPIIPNASTITVDIAPTLDAILAHLPQKGRHAIRRAERDGVIVTQVPATIENCKNMFALLSETAEGQFGLRAYKYYETYWQTFEKAGYGQLFFASVNGTIVAGAYAMSLGTKSTYKDGASVRDRSVYGASHLLQWHVIQWAKGRGATIHDLCGAPPSASIDDTHHPHYGIGRFKRSFNRTVTDYIGCYDVVVRPLAYSLWQHGLERLYRGLYYRRTKDYYY